jgi:hypothetical protein
MVPIQTLESPLSYTVIQAGGDELAHRDAPLTHQNETYSAIALVDAVDR